MTSPDTLCPKHSKDRNGGSTPGTFNGCKACEKVNALTELRALCPPGTTVYTVLRSVSRSGMTRSISPLVMVDGEPRNLTWLVSKALGWPVRQDFNDGVRCDGAGMDMGFHLVHSLSYALHGMQGAEIVRCYCKATDDPTADHFRPGYTLNHRWL